MTKENQPIPQSEWETMVDNKVVNGVVKSLDNGVFSGGIGALEGLTVLLGVPAIILTTIASYPYYETGWTHPLVLTGLSVALAFDSARQLRIAEVTQELKENLENDDRYRLALSQLSVENSKDEDDSYSPNLRGLRNVRRLTDTLSARAQALTDEEYSNIESSGYERWSRRLAGEKITQRDNENQVITKIDIPVLPIIGLGILGHWLNHRDSK